MCKSVFAQNTIVGVVQDTAQLALRGANVRLVTDLDTLTKSTDEFGHYRFDNVRGNILYLTFNLLGYEAGYYSMFLLKDKSVVEVPKVILEPMSFVIKDVNIVKVIPMVIMNDTIQFNFDAYKFRENSLLEEAIKALPGFNVSRDGSVYYNGKPIRRAQVNSKDFFGGDLLTATKNLPTGFIQNLQVIDYYGLVDEATGFKDGEPEKIINIILKPDKKQIYFGHATLGGGTNERFLGSLGVNRFNDGKELSIVGTINNTNANMIYLGGMAGHQNRSLMDVGDYADPVDGLNTVSNVGISVSDQLSKRFSFSGAYNFVRQRNVTDGFSRLTSSYIGNTITRSEDYVVQTDDYNHNVKFGINGKFRNQDELKVDGKFTLNMQSSYNLKNTEINNYELVNTGVFQDTIDSFSPNGEVEVFYSKYFAKKGRKFVAQLSVKSNNLDKEEKVNERYLETETNSTQISDSYLQNQLINQNNITNSARATFTYIEPVGNSGLIEFNYLYDITAINSLRTVYNRLDPENPYFIDSLAVDYDYKFRYNHFGFNFQHESLDKRFKVNIGAAVEPIVLDGNLNLQDSSYSYENINLVPSASLLYRFDKDMDLQVDYRGKNNQPNFNQIAPVVDNSNSRNVIIGNPELKSDFSHRMSFRLRKSIPSRAQYFETSFAYNFVTDKIVSDKRSLDNSTIQQVTYRNASGYYDTRWFYLFNTPFISEDLQLDLTGSTDYFNQPSYIDDRKRITKQLFFNQSLQLRYMWNNTFESGFAGNYNVNNTRYDIPYQTRISVHTWQLGINARSYITEHLSIGAEMSQRFNSGYTNSFMNENQTIINGFLEYSFLSNNNGLIRLQGFDLLDQNERMGIYSEYIGNDVYEARNNRLGRYFMLSLSFRIQKYPKKK